jgi:hypothetical protein
MNLKKKNEYINKNFLNNNIKKYKIDNFDQAGRKLCN